MELALLARSQKVSYRRGLTSELGDVGDVAVEDYAMATVIESAEGLMPTYDEARKRPDWPKWEEAI